jgi:hypothetical protein
MRRAGAATDPARRIHFSGPTEFETFHLTRLDKADGVVPCQYCETGALPLYVLPVKEKLGQAEMLICRFCYLRLSGLKPSRAAAGAPAAGGQRSC